MDGQQIFAGVLGSVIAALVVTGAVRGAQLLHRRVTDPVRVWGLAEPLNRWSLNLRITVENRRNGPTDVMEIGVGWRRRVGERKRFLLLFRRRAVVEGYFKAPDWPGHYMTYQGEAFSETFPIWTFRSQSDNFRPPDFVYAKVQAAPRPRILKGKVPQEVIDHINEEWRQFIDSPSYGSS